MTGMCMVDGQWMVADDPLLSARVAEGRDVNTLCHPNGTIMAFPLDDFRLLEAMWKGTWGS